ncbi:MAG TPA: DUF6544 family protein [Cyclobacteriaceae bacterium]|jgi:hypothetical protein|nr:DUF6544 family protein [Cyclobacteriaceae bacterium]
MLLDYFLILLLAVHGLLHMVGFASSVGLITPHQRWLTVMTQGQLAVAGLCWLITGVLFILSATLFYLKWDFYWAILLPAFVFSQVLVVMYWPLDKYGTVVNMIVLVVIVVSTGAYSFDRKASREVKALKRDARHPHGIISEQRMGDLPPVVKRWMVKSGVVGTKEPVFVHVVQKGFLRTGKEAPWAPFQAQQYFSLDPPAFVWKADMHMNDFVEIKGRDKLADGRGNMLIKAESLFPVANARGKEIDQGTFIRFMAEISWFPQAALRNYIRWKELDDNRAQAFITYGNTSVTGVFTFNGDGLPVLFEAKRYGNFNGKFSLETWSVKTTGFKTFQGITIGNSNDVTWKLRSGNFTWLKLEVTQLDYAY